MEVQIIAQSSHSFIGINMGYQEFSKQGCKPIKAWVDDVEFDEKSKQQLFNLSTLPIMTYSIAGEVLGVY